MGIYDRDYWADKHKEIENGGKPAAKADRSPARPAQVARRPLANASRPVQRNTTPAHRSGPPDLAHVTGRWWFQLVLWLAVGAVLYALFHHLTGR